MSCSVEGISCDIEYAQQGRAARIDALDLGEPDHAAWRRDPAHRDRAHLFEQPGPVAHTRYRRRCPLQSRTSFLEGKTGDTSSQGTLGVAGDLARLLHQYGVQDIQTHSSLLECRAGTPAGQSFAEDMRLVVRPGMPFVRKWGHLPDHYEPLYQDMVHEMQQPGARAYSALITAWGTKA